MRIANGGRTALSAKHQKKLRSIARAGLSALLNESAPLLDLLEPARGETRSASGFPGEKQRRCVRQRIHQGQALPDAEDADGCGQTVSRGRVGGDDGDLNA